MVYSHVEGISASHSNCLNLGIRSLRADLVRRNYMEHHFRGSRRGKRSPRLVDDLQTGGIEEWQQRRGDATVSRMSTIMLRALQGAWARGLARRLGVGAKGRGSRGEAGVEEGIVVRRAEIGRK